MIALNNDCLQFTLRQFKTIPLSKLSPRRDMPSFPTEFELRVLHTLVRGDPEERLLSDQIASATVTSRDYSGVGLFVNFEIPAAIPRLKTSNRYIEETPKVHLHHPALSSGAGALLWLKDGLISTLECYAYEGQVAVR